MEMKREFNQIKYNNRFNKENYDTRSIRFKKGELEKIVSHAKDMGDSLNGFVNRAVEETMENDLKKSKKNT